MIFERHPIQVSLLTLIIREEKCSDLAQLSIRVSPPLKFGFFSRPSISSIFLQSNTTQRVSLHAWRVLNGLLAKHCSSECSLSLFSRQGRLRFCTWGQRAPLSKMVDWHAYKIMCKEMHLDRVVTKCVPMCMCVPPPKKSFFSCLVLLTWQRPDSSSTTKAFYLIFSSSCLVTWSKRTLYEDAKWCMKITSDIYVFQSHPHLPKSKGGQARQTQQNDPRPPKV